MLILVVLLANINKSVVLCSVLIPNVFMCDMRLEMCIKRENIFNCHIYSMGGKQIISCITSVSSFSNIVFHV